MNRSEINTLNYEKTSIQNFNSLIALHSHPKTNEIYIAEQLGKIYRIIREKEEIELVLDITSKLIPDLEGEYEERGLLDFVFHPTGTILYVVYSAPTSSSSSKTFLYENLLVSYKRKNQKWDLNSEEILFTVPKQNTFHQGGRLLIYKNYLYVTVGDDGPQGDPFLHGQDLSVPYGKLFRTSLNKKIKFEMVAYGLRNVWSISADPVNDRIFLGDVGYNTREEVNLFYPEEGQLINYGWPLFEGSLITSSKKERENKKYKEAWNRMEENKQDLKFPIYEYPTKPGRSVIGGFFINDEIGYVFGDLTGYLFTIVENKETLKWELDQTKRLPSGYSLKSFGQDTKRGIVYALVDKKQGIKSGQAEILKISF